jgi:hypothetical protein
MLNPQNLTLTQAAVVLFSLLVAGSVTALFWYPW